MFLRFLAFIWLINLGQLLIAQCPPLLQEEVTALSPAAGDRLGYDVAVASGLAAVSASLYDLPSPDAGAVHLLGFDSLTGRWELQNGGDPLLAPGIDSGAGGAGLDVDTDGFRVVAGYRHHSVNGLWSGVACVWEPDGAGGWQALPLISGSTSTVLSESGSVAIEGDWLALGAAEHDVPNTASGAVWLFQRDTISGTFLESQILSSTLASIGDEFGTCVDLDGQRLAIGAPMEDGAETNQGYVYLYQWEETANQWLLEAKLSAPVAMAGERFGTALVLNGDRLLVGAPSGRVDGPTSLETGEAHLFERDPFTGIWSSVEEFRPADLAAGDAFGSSVALSDETLSIGAVGSDMGAADAGSVYSYLQGSAGDSWQPLIRNDGDEAGDFFGQSAAISGEFLFMGAPLSDQFSNNGGALKIQYAGETDCDGDGLIDGCQIEENPALDCDLDGVIDSCQIAADPTLDCNGNQQIDSCDVQAGEPDCNSNGIPDVCDTLLDPALDCDMDGAIDSCEIDQDPALDCDQSGSLDTCDLLAGATDCDGDEVIDSCEIAQDPTLDCDSTGALDSCELASGTALDCNLNGIPDPCDVDSGLDGDCDGDGELDSCAITQGAEDCDLNGIPDLCQPDCNGNGIADPCDLVSGLGLDCNGNGVPDACDFINGTSADCNDNDLLDDCEIAQGFAEDCDVNGVIDLCDLASGAEDCNANQLLDECEIADGFAGDCDTNGQIDSCEIAGGVEDCNSNGIPDFCDLTAGTSTDSNTNSIPDDCEETTFTRGECNGDDSITIADPVFLLGFLFSGGSDPECEDAADSNDDGAINIGDVVFILDYLFSSGAEPPAPFNACGIDPTADPLDCETFSVCP